MKKIGRYLIFILLLFFISTIFVFAEVSVTADLSDKVIGVGEAFTLIITVNGGKADELNIPSNIDGLNLKNISQSKNFIFNNGVLNTTEKYYYIFVPTKEGKYKIEGISVSSKRNVYEVPPLEIEVTENSARNPYVRNTTPEEDSEYTKNIKIDDVYVENKISKKKVYINEALYITQKAYTKIPVKLLGISSLPARNDFFYIADKTEYNSTREIINGVNLSVKPLRKEVLYPLKTGKKSIETTSFVFQIGDGFMSEQIERGGQVFEVEVISLPKEGKPKVFSGAVGNFKFDVSVNDKNVVIGDTVVITVEAVGDGNSTVVDIPKIDTNIISKFFTVYTPKISETNFFQGDKIVTSKSEEYVLVAKENGSVYIDSLTFNYFSPQEKEYKSIVSDGFLINIEGEKLLSENNNTTYVMPIKNRLENNKSDFNIFKSLYFYVYIILIILVSFSVMLVFKLKERKNIYTSSVNENGKKEELFFNNIENTENRKEYLRSIERAFKSLLCKKLEIKEKVELNNIIKKMNEKNIDSETIDKVKNIINLINEEIYGGSQKENKNYIPEIKNIINDIDNKLRKN